MLALSVILALLGPKSEAVASDQPPAFQTRPIVSRRTIAHGSPKASTPPPCAPNIRKTTAWYSARDNKDESSLHHDASHSDKYGGNGSHVTSSRRAFLNHVAGAAAVTTAAAGGTLPSFGATARGVEEVKKGIEADFLSRRYYVTGDLTPSLYRPDCLFTDPTTRVESVERYTAAVKLLFDPDNAQVDLLSLVIKDDTHIFAEWRLQGYLKFPWHPYVKPYTGTTLYTLDSNGLISLHEETWSISALEAARATITPTAGPQAAMESS
ncbi:unnamed protein product [Ectocarpus sp. CCAP 1310/34]|nr:unnamed protein product [Ectocarpus sp. CCAP 1310/34]